MQVSMRRIVCTTATLGWLGMCGSTFAGSPGGKDIDFPIAKFEIVTEFWLRIESLNEELTFFEYGGSSPIERLMIELINRARADPGAEAARIGIDLNQGLDPGTISDTPKQPLASHPSLIDAARDHSQWMLDTDNFSHVGVKGSSPGARIERAGYLLTGSWTWGENISWAGTTGTPDLLEFTTALYEGFFTSPKHRENMLNNAFKQIGIGLIPGEFHNNQRNWNALMATQKFARN
jgi:hypothetical protein